MDSPTCSEGKACGIIILGRACAETPPPRSQGFWGSDGAFGECKARTEKPRSLERGVVT
ncbi:hypothetical protein phiLo_140 [Thermus phage phiLo]|nr:hypothetical protein phiLo_140 [Thermus phage phiLo]